MGNHYRGLNHFYTQSLTGTYRLTSCRSSYFSIGSPSLFFPGVKLLVGVLDHLYPVVKTYDSPGKRRRPSQIDYGLLSTTGRSTLNPWRRTGSDFIHVGTTSSRYRKVDNLSWVDRFPFYQRPTASRRPYDLPVFDCQNTSCLCGL